MPEINHINILAGATIIPLSPGAYLEVRRSRNSTWIPVYEVPPEDMAKVLATSGDQRGFPSMYCRHFPGRARIWPTPTENLEGRELPRFGSDHPVFDALIELLAPRPPQPYPKADFAAGELSGSAKRDDSVKARPTDFSLEGLLTTLDHAAKNELAAITLLKVEAQFLAAAARAYAPRPAYAPPPHVASIAPAPDPNDLDIVLDEHRWRGSKAGVQVFAQDEVVCWIGDIERAHDHQRLNIRSVPLESPPLFYKSVGNNAIADAAEWLREQLPKEATRG